MNKPTKNTGAVKQVLVFAGMALCFFAGLLCFIADVPDGTPHWFSLVLASKAVGLALWGVMLLLETFYKSSDEEEE